MSNPTSNLQLTSALEKLPDQRQTLLHSEAVALRDEIDRLQRLATDAEIMALALESRDREIEKLQHDLANAIDGRNGEAQEVERHKAWVAYWHFKHDLHCQNGTNCPALEPHPVTEWERSHKKTSTPSTHPPASVDETEEDRHEPAEATVRSEWRDQRTRTAINGPASNKEDRS